MNIVFTYLKKQKKILLFAMLFAAINQIFSLLDPYIFQFIIDDYLLKVNELSQDVFLKGVGTLFLAAMGVALVSRTAKNIQEYLVSVITERLGTSMYADSVEHTFSLEYEIFEDKRSGEILQKMQKARDDSKILISNFIGVVFLSIVGIVFVLIYTFTVHWIAGLAFFAIIPILSYFTFILSKKIKQAQKDIVTQMSELSGATTETLRNVELVKSLGLEEQEIKRLNNVNDKILTLELTKAKKIRTLNFIQGTLINFLRTSLLFIIFVLIYNGYATPGQFFTLMFYSFFLFAPLSNLGMIAAQYQEAKASNEALQEILKIPPRKKDPKAKVLPEIHTISVDHLSFTYGSSTHPSLEDISLQIGKGETIALCGRSGSGKSTLTKLLVGLYLPTKGRILYNEESSVDFDHLRKRIGLVAQETQLFAGTIKENLLFVNPKASDAECMSALKMASIDYIVHRGKKKLNTIIGENGIKLSGGEKQRLAIARAILRHPDIIIFDEATSSLDSKTENEITATIKEIARQKPELIVILIAHRLSTITHADRIYVLEKGKIVEQGSHKELLASGRQYFESWNDQMR